jgi:hypothetical protein
MNFLILAAGALLASSPSEGHERTNVTLRGTRVPSKAIVCRNRWGTPMLPYGRTDGGAWAMNSEVQKQLAALEAKREDQDKNQAKINTIDGMISRLEASITETHREFMNAQAEQKLQRSKLNQIAEEIEKKREEVAKSMGEFAESADRSAAEEARKETETKIAELQQEASEMAEKLRSLKASQPSNYAQNNDSMAVELERLKELAIKMKSSLGYSLTANIDPYYVENSLLQPPKGSTASDFGLSSTREFNRYNPKGDPRPFSNEITPFRPNR